MITIDVYIANLNKKSKWTGGQYKTKLGQNALFIFLSQIVTKISLTNQNYFS